MTLERAKTRRRDRWPPVREEPRGCDGALSAPVARGDSRSPGAVTGVRGYLVLGGNGNGVIARASPPKPPVVLVGEVYLDVADGVEVRVLDSRLAAGSAREFVVETVDGSRPGERWVRSAVELRAVASPPPLQACGEREADPARALRQARSLAERLVEAGQMVLETLVGRERGVPLHVVAERAGQLASALHNAAAMLEESTAAKTSKPGGNAR